MIRTITLLCLLAAVSCQYSRQRAPPMRDPQPFYDDEEPQQDDYRPQAPPPRVQPPPARRSSSLLRPASVHYVNIGQELAGDYKFGYDTGKGDDGQSFREETRLPDGSVQGAYGYVDDTGKQRIVKYIAGKDGFKVLKDGETADKPAAARAPPANRAPVQYAPPAQPAYRAPVQSAPPAQPAYRAPAQPAYRAPAQPAYRAPAQPAYRAPAQPAYRAPVQSAPPAQPAYRAPAQPAYRAPPAPQRSYEPEPSRPNRRQYAPPKRAQDDEYDYDYPENEIRERRLVPVDTSLFNYNIGTQQDSRD